MRAVGTYAGWGDFFVRYDEKAKTFAINHEKKAGVIKNFKIDNIILNGKSLGGVESFEKCEYKTGRANTWESSYLFVKYSKGSTDVKDVTLKFNFDDKGVKIETRSSSNCIIELSGDISWGNGNPDDVYPMSTKKEEDIIRSAVGPAASNKDDMLFDRLSDDALCLKGGKALRIKYDYEKKSYVFKVTTGKLPSEKTIKITVQNSLIKDLYSITYTPLNKNTTFKKPPTGWMSWYSVEFEACEERILKNARWMSENLKKYGAECIWVDWEWRHRDYKGKYDDGTNSFCPDKQRYPQGLSHTADKIKELGLVPALWIAFSTDVGKNKFIEENPDMLLVELEKWWVGAYVYDYSHPAYLNGFLPEALSNVKKWGFEALKFDGLSDGLMWHDEKHQNMYNPNLSSKQAHRKVLEITRSVMGDNFYMLQCALANDHDLLCGIDYFDAARIGGDIFSWKDFMRCAVGTAMKFYSLHNNVVYTDVDCVVMREKFSDMNQAASRIYFVSMLGCPMNFGDEFDALDEPRLNLIKQCLPVLEMHPMDICKKKKPKGVLKMNLAIDKEWESYNVVNVFNTLSEKNSAEVDLDKDLGLDKSEYLVYDYTGDKFIGIVDSSFKVELDDCASKVFSVREKKNRPQLISTSRHISQGAAEIKDMQWNDDKELYISAELIENVPYTVTLYIPEGYSSKDLEHIEGAIYKKTIIPKSDGVTDIRIKF